MGEVKTYDDGPADVVPHLLHGSVVDKVQVVSFYEDTGAADLVGHQLALAERDTTAVAPDGVVHGDTAVHLGLLTGLDELHLARGLGKTLALVDG